MAARDSPIESEALERTGTSSFATPPECAALSALCKGTRFVSPPSKTFIGSVGVREAKGNCVLALRLSASVPRTATTGAKPNINNCGC